MGSYYKPVNESQTINASSTKSMTGFWWRHDPAKGLANIDSAALYLWNLGRPINGKWKGDDAGTTFNSLLRSEKLTLIEDRLKEEYLGMAKLQNTTSKVETAQVTAAVENETNYELSGD